MKTSDGLDQCPVPINSKPYEKTVIIILIPVDRILQNKSILRCSRSPAMAQRRARSVSYRFNWR